MQVQQRCEHDILQKCQFLNKSIQTDVNRKSNIAAKCIWSKNFQSLNFPNSEHHRRELIHTYIHIVQMFSLLSDGFQM